MLGRAVPGEASNAVDTRGLNGLDSGPPQLGSAHPHSDGHASLAVLSGWVRSGAFQPLCREGHASRQALGTIINNLVCDGSHHARVAHRPAAAGERMKNLRSLRLQVAVAREYRGGSTGPYYPSGQSAAHLGASGDEQPV